MRIKNFKQSIVYVTHHVNDFVLDNFCKLVAQLDSTFYDVFLLYHTDHHESQHIKLSYNTGLFICNTKKIKELGYNQICLTLLPGSINFLHQLFFLHFSTYEKYWFAEYDVLFTGNWSTLMDDCREHLPDYDFLSCHIGKYNLETNKMWPWWYNRNHVGFPYYQCIKGFNPICRYSNRALACLDLYMKQGFSAHSEVMITTCLYHHGMKIGDIGGLGEFVPEGWENRYYLAGEGVNNGTMRYRPIYTREEIEKTGLKNKLFHPLKE